MPKKFPAFSLIELLLVLALITILSTFAIPSLSSFLEKTQEDKLLSQLLNAISLTRNEAISQNIVAALKDTQDAFTISANQKIIYSLHHTNTAGKLFFRAFPNRRNDLQFLPNGFSNAENGTFWYCRLRATNPQWAVVLNRVGRARVVYPDEQNEILDDHEKKLICWL